MKSQDELGHGQGIVVANPIPPTSSGTRPSTTACWRRRSPRPRHAGVHGKAVTPFLLATSSSIRGPQPRGQSRPGAQQCARRRRDRDRLVGARMSLDDAADRIVVFGDVIDDIVVVPAGRSGPTPTRRLRSGARGRFGREHRGLARHARAPPSTSSAGSASRRRTATADFWPSGRVPHLQRDRRPADRHDRDPRRRRPAHDAHRARCERRARARMRSGCGARWRARSCTSPATACSTAQHLSGFQRLMGRGAPAGSRSRSIPGRSASWPTSGRSDSSMVAGASILFPNLDEGRILTGLHDPEQIATALGEALPGRRPDAGRDRRDGRGPRPGRVPPGAARSRSWIPTGAGDAFSAGFLASWLRTRDARSSADARGRPRRPRRRDRGRPP